MQSLSPLWKATLHTLLLVALALALQIKFLYFAIDRLESTQKGLYVARHGRELLAIVKKMDVPDGATSGVISAEIYSAGGKANMTWIAPAAVYEKMRVGDRVYVERYDD